MWSRLPSCHQPVGTFAGQQQRAAAATAAQASSALTEVDKVKKEKKMSAAMQLYLQRLKFNF
jgi:hypothetical protein